FASNARTSCRGGANPSLRTFYNKSRLRNKAAFLCPVDWDENAVRLQVMRAMREARINPLRTRSHTMQRRSQSQFAYNKKESLYAE
ncbi:hypothetical protein ACFSW8_09820, partial [Rubritalea tangerina]